jgi:mannosyltransferase
MTAHVLEVMDDPVPQPKVASAPSRSGVHWTVALLLLVALAVACRMPYLTERSLWYDEASSWQTARFPFAELMKSVRLNVHMPLYYLLLKGWMAGLGESVISLRGFSITFGALTVIAMGLFGRELFHASSSALEVPVGRAHSEARVFGLLLAGLLAVSPCQVFASIEARMYSMGTFLAVLCGWLLLRLLRDVRSKPRWEGYCLVLAVLPYAHHYALLTVAAHYLFLGLYLVHLAALGEREMASMILRRGLVVAAIASMAYLPGLDILRTQAGRVQQDYWVRPLSWESFFGTFNEFIVPRPDYDQLPQGWIACAVFVACCLFVAWHGCRGDGFVLALAVVPMILSATVSTVTPIWVGRFFRFTQPFVLAIVALAAWKLTGRSKAGRVILLTSLWLGLLSANVVFWKGLDVESGRGVQGAIEYIMARKAPDEIIVALDMIQYFPAKYYVGGRTRIRMVQPDADMFWGWHLIRPADLVTPDELDDELDRGVWLIGTAQKPAVTARLTTTTPSDEQVFTYYNHLHARVYVHHYSGPRSGKP